MGSGEWQRAMRRTNIWILKVGDECGGGRQVLRCMCTQRHRLNSVAKVRVSCVGAQMHLKIYLVLDNSRLGGSSMAEDNQLKLMLAESILSVDGVATLYTRNVRS
jgi:hypothetical protein